MLSGRGWVDAALGKLESLAIRTDPWEIGLTFHGACQGRVFLEVKMLPSISWVVVSKIFRFTPTWGNDPIGLAYFSNGLKTHHQLVSHGTHFFHLFSW